LRETDLKAFFLGVFLDQFDEDLEGSVVVSKDSPTAKFDSDVTSSNEA